VESAIRTGAPRRKWYGTVVARRLLWRRRQPDRAHPDAGENRRRPIDPAARRIPPPATNQTSDPGVPVEAN